MVSEIPIYRQVIRPEFLVGGLNNRKHQASRILIGVWYPRGPHLKIKIWLYLTAFKLHCWKPQAKQQVETGTLSH